MRSRGWRSYLAPMSLLNSVVLHRHRHPFLGHLLIEKPAAAGRLGSLLQCRIERDPQASITSPFAQLGVLPGCKRTVAHPTHHAAGARASCTCACVYVTMPVDCSHCVPLSVWPRAPCTRASITAHSPRQIAGILCFLPLSCSSRTAADVKRPRRQTCFLQLLIPRGSTSHPHACEFFA